ASGRNVLTINRPAPVMPPRALPDRPTGATARTPGVPLDEELRRTRVFNNRQPRVAPPSTAGGAAAAPGGGVTTGAVERPRPVERPNGERPREDQPAAPPAYKPEPRVRPGDPGASERPSPPPARREEPPSYRTERPAPSESRPSRSEPPPRQEQPRQQAPRQ